jgi:hypothetical protein
MIIVEAFYPSQTTLLAGHHLAGFGIALQMNILRPAVPASCRISTLPIKPFRVEQARGSSAVSIKSYRARRWLEGWWPLREG